MSPADPFKLDRPSCDFLALRLSHVFCILNLIFPPNFALVFFSIFISLLIDLGEGGSGSHYPRSRAAYAFLNGSQKIDHDDSAGKIAATLQITAAII